MDFPAYKIRHPWYEFTKATYTSETVSSSKGKLHRLLLRSAPSWIGTLESGGTGAAALTIQKFVLASHRERLQSNPELFQPPLDSPHCVPSLVFSEKVRLRSGRAVILDGAEWGWYRSLLIDFDTRRANALSRGSAALVSKHGLKLVRHDLLKDGSARMLQVLTDPTVCRNMERRSQKRQQWRFSEPVSKRCSHAFLICNRKPTIVLQSSVSGPMTRLRVHGNCYNWLTIYTLLKSLNETQQNRTPPLPNPHKYLSFSSPSPSIK